MRAFRTIASRLISRFLVMWQTFTSAVSQTMSVGRMVGAFSLVLLSLTQHWQIDAIASKAICGQRPIATPGTITYANAQSWPGQFPWHVALYRTEQHLSISYACGGFLVGERTVITAAHCVTAPSGYQMVADELIARLGLYDLLTLGRHSQEHRVGKVRRHGNFTLGSPRHDLALLTLRTVVEFGDFVQPICLPVEANALDGVEFGIVSGWGLTEMDIPARTLRSTVMPVVSFIRCLASDATLFGPILYEGMFCAGWENGTNVCNGDSGGAFVANLNGSWTALGVVSFTGMREDTNGPQQPFRCNTESLSGFISIPKYLGWIASVASLEESEPSRHTITDSNTPTTASERISEQMCQSYRESCTGNEDFSYLTSVVRPVHIGGTSGRYARLVIDCFAVLISDRFLLAPASCYGSTAQQFILLEVAGQAVDYRIKTFHQHPNFVNNGPTQDQSNLALIELERKVSLSTCQFVCLWTGGVASEPTIPDNIFLHSAVNVSAGDKSIESSEVTSRGNRCYDELLAPRVMQQQQQQQQGLDGSRDDRLVGIVLERTCTKIRFIKVAPFLGWIERIVWQGHSGHTRGTQVHNTSD
ncbi:ovochymase-2-like [Anopheles maculipalpis]|uniref:ovochymase-2-like n=1 Tax=Anopheles maculipalpis TaxID=1496333 RepID=UPI002159A1BC|nr:ovochymase-2-like [Anopheles maculipalpis]